jgi:drug/metabolite transporter (DMT)-like permease
MVWILAALAAPAIWAFTNVLDQDLVNRRSKDPLFLVGITGVFLGIPSIVTMVTGRFVMLEVENLALAIVVAVLGLSAYAFYYFALRDDDVADVIIFWNLTPVFVAILAFFFAHERLSLVQLIAVGLIVLSSFVAESAPNRKGSSRRAYALMCIASLVVAVEVTLGKVLYNRVEFIPGFAWVSLTILVCALGLLVSRWHVRHRKNSWKDVGTYVVSELCDTGASSLKAFAVSLGPASVVQALEGIQSLFVMAFESLGLVGRRTQRTLKQNIRVLTASALAILGLLLIA